MPQMLRQIHVRPMTVQSLLMSLLSYRPAQLGILMLLPLLACAIDPPPAPPKREFRAVWVATFHNIDWPSAKGLSAQDQQAEFQDLIRRQKENGMNALIVQVRPSGDAFYQSQLVPWSEFISGKQGQAPEPFYDPLQFMVAESHQAGMEFHAWMNPFRAVSHKRFSSVVQNHVALTKPEWCFDYGERTYLNPGLPEVRNYLVNVIMEVVNNYDIDGIHFDDYFYPYEQAGEPFVGDAVTYRAFGTGYGDIHEWRRHNLDLFIEQLSDSIRAVKPWVKFGISPVGIWRNKRDDPRGSRTTSSYTAYDMLHADVRFWLVKGWIDYVAPQLYWSTEHPYANYSDLLPWWADNAFGRHVYVGHAAFKLKEDQSRYWENPSQLPTQLAMRRMQQGRIHGGVFYSAGSFVNNPHGVEDLLRTQYHRYPALIPPMPWKDPVPPAPVKDAEGRIQLTQVLLSWAPPEPASDGDTATRYVVYRFPAGEEEDLSRPDRVLGVTDSPVFLDQEPAAAPVYYLVTALDRLHNESSPVKIIPSKMNMPSSPLRSPFLTVYPPPIGGQ